MLDDRDVDLADFLPVSARPVEEMRADLTDRVAGFTDPDLRALMQAFLADQAFLRGLLSRPRPPRPCTMSTWAGLLEHSLAVADLADDICRRYPGLNRDLLVAGALLHDVGKVNELRYERSFDYTDDRQAAGPHRHRRRNGRGEDPEPPRFSTELAILLKHMLLSHHGQYEYGSPKRPKTLEAVILNFLDDLDSKINGVRAHLDKGAWTGNRPGPSITVFTTAIFSRASVSRADGAEAAESPLAHRSATPPVPQRGNRLLPAGPHSTAPCRKS